MRTSMLRYALALGAGALLLAPASALAAADLSIVSLTTSPNPIVSWTNTDATVTVVARNTGDASATTVAITFSAANEIEELRATACPAGFTAYPQTLSAQHQCVWGTMEPGTVATMVLQVRLDQTESPVPSFTHSVTIGQARVDGIVPDPTPADTTATETVLVGFDSTINPETGKPGGSSGGDGGGGTTTSAPQVTALTLSPETFRAAARGPSAVAARAPVGTTVTTRLSAAATETFRVERAAAGRRVGGRCAALTRANRRGVACTRWTALSGRFTAAGEAGVNRLRFSGRLGGLQLAPGRYRLTVRATDARGRASAVRRAGFRVVA